MLDRWTLRIVKSLLRYLADFLKKSGCTADQVSVVSFCIGMGVLPALYFQEFGLALFCIFVNRIGDGLDGTLARMTRISDAGGYLDIVLDFIFYAVVVFGFALADQQANGLAAAALLLSFVGTGCSFLAFAVMAERRGILNLVYPSKGIYYLGGLAEGTETLIFFTLCCVFPSCFALLAWIFTGICVITALTRLVGGYFLLK